MSTVKVLDNADATIKYIEEANVIHAEFEASIAGESLRHALNAGVDVMRKHGANKWLSDNRKVPPLSDEDTEWINTHWVRDAIASGWQYWALVVPQDIRARMNLNDIVKQFYDQGVRVMVFTDPDEAMTWLKKVE